MKYEINLTNPKWQETPQNPISKGFRLNLLLIPFIALCISFSFFVQNAMSTYLTIHREKKKLRHFQKELNHPHTSNINTDISELAFISRIYLDRKVWSKRIEMLVDNFPEGFTISSLKCGKKHVEITGSFIALEKKSPMISIQLYINQLKAALFFEDFFSSLVLKEIRLADTTSGRQYIFTLHAVNAI